MGGAESAERCHRTRAAPRGVRITEGTKSAPGSECHPSTERGNTVVVSDDGGDEAVELEAEREAACGVEHQGASGDVLVDGDGVT
jgi:hypothetical protein